MRWPVRKGRSAATRAGGPRAAHGPSLKERDRITRVQGHDRIEKAHITRAHVAHDARSPRRDEQLEREAATIRHGSEHVACLDEIAHRSGGLEGKASVAIQRWRCGAWLDERAAQDGQSSEWAPDAVDHLAEQSRAQLDGQRQLLAHHRLADAQPGGLLEHLQRGDVAAHAQDLAQQRGVPDPHELVERHPTQARRLGQRPHHARQRPGGHRGLTR